MLFVLTRSNLLKQLPDLNENILRLSEIVTASDLGFDQHLSKHL